MLNITETSEQKVWFTSDLHLGHQRDFIWKARGYASADDHTYSVIQSINAHVEPNDILFMGGDLCLNTNIHKLHEYLELIQCQNFWMLWGNHNNPHEKSIYRLERDKMTPRGIREIYPLKYRNVTFLGHYCEVSINGQFIILFHYPLLSWNHLSTGAWALVGHEHGGLPATRPENKNGKILDIGWDLYNKPLSFNEVKIIMDTKQIASMGHHVANVDDPVSV